MGTTSSVRRSGNPKPLRFVLLFALAATLLLGCTDRDEAYIQGSWAYSEPSVGGVTTQSSVHTNWTFDKGSVLAHSCCDFRPGMSGSYRIVESKDDALVLELYDLEGATDQDSYRIEIAINRDRETLAIQALGPFLRDGP